MSPFQVIAWDGRDQDDQYTLRIFGRTQNGDSVALGTHFYPFFYVKEGTDIPKRFKPISTETVSAKDLWGFQNNQTSRFVKLTFRTLKEMRMCSFSVDTQVYEANIDPVLRFMHLSGIKSTGWLDPGACEPDDDATCCTVNLWSPKWQNIHPAQNDAIAPIRIMSFDIECYSESGAFPNPKKPSDVIFQIGMTTKEFGKDGWVDRTCLCLSKTEGHPWFETEKQLLEAFGKHIREVDPDILTGWNIFGFDLEYLHGRAVMHGVSTEWGRIRNVESDLVIKFLSSSALGSNELKMVPMPGRYVFDLFQDVKREHKLESYSLNNVSKHFLNDQKNDMPVREIFASFASKDTQRLGQVADYCIKDTELPHALLEKLFQIQNQVEMAKACWVPLSYLSERGQQIKVFSQMAYKARELNFIIPTFRQSSKCIRGECSGKIGDGTCDMCQLPPLCPKCRQHASPCPDCDEYQGATVLEAQTGAYYNPITALDFASLYPSIMCAHNLCFSTLVMDPKFDNLPGVEYEEFGQHRFAVNVPSLLPVILTDLKAFRKKAKKLMAAAEGTPMEAIYNGQQLAYKISMNSIYGFTGASKGMLPLVAIASSVTMRGRQMIEETKNYVEENFPGAKVRYGDSVMPDAPVLVRRNGVVSVHTIASLGETWVEYPGFLKDGTEKEQCDVDTLEAWTHDGWQSIKRVIRHKCQKKIYRVLTHTGLVDVTEDHSLLSPCLDLLKPKDVQIGQKLYHSFPTTTFNSSASPEEAFILGMFVGDGSCGVYECPSGRKATWAINNKDLTLLEKCKKYCELVHSGFTFVIMDTLASSGVYKLSPRGGSVIDLATEYRQMCYDGQAKKIPLKVFGSSAKVFLDGLWAADGCRKDEVNTKNQVTAQWYYMFLRNMNFDVSINTRSDKPNIFRLTWSDAGIRKDPIAIKKIDILHESWDGFVYDLETEAGTFQAGVGQMIVKNTDSVMVEFDCQGRKGHEAIEYSWSQGELAAEQCTKLFKAPNDLEMEKVYCPYFLYSKKRYAAKMYEKKGQDIIFKKVDIKGLQVVRRDSCAFVRDTLKKILNMILESSDPLPVIDEARSAARTLLSGKVSNDHLLMSKQLGSAYKVPMPHVAVVNKIKNRSPGSEPQQGDRVSFIIVAGPGRMYEKSEDPAWALQKGLRPDYHYYFTNQFKKPIQDLLEPLVDPKDLFTPVVLRTLETATSHVLNEGKKIAELEARKNFLSRFTKSLKTT